MRADTDIGGPLRSFPNMDWSQILRAPEGDESRRRGLTYIVEAYWKPLYIYVRRKGVDVEEAKDLIQGFFARLLEREFLGGLDPARGRLRSYLKSALANYMINEWEREGAVKRGGRIGRVPLDFDGAERDLTDVSGRPDDALEREWALGILERAMLRLQAEFQAGVWKGPFELVRTFFWSADPPSYAEAGARHGMSATQVKSFLHRVRSRYAAHLREEIALTVTDRSEVEAEIGGLLRSLAS